MRRQYAQGLSHSGYVKTDGQFYPCQVIEMSSEGAKLTFDGPVELPPRFAIQLTTDGRVTRNCVMTWSEGSQLGVSFEGDETADQSP